MSSESVPSKQAVEHAHESLYQQGLKNRKEVVGTDHVQRSVSQASAFSLSMQQYATESCWASIWSRDGLGWKQRSMINIAMLAALGKSPELGVHARGAVRNGVTEAELREILLQVACYAGMPTGIEAFRVVDRVLGEMEQSGELPEGYREKRSSSLS